MTAWIDPQSIMEWPRTGGTALRDCGRPVHPLYFSVICTDYNTYYEIPPMTSKLHFSKSRKCEKSLGVWSETDMISESKYQFNNSERSTMFVHPMCDLLDITLDWRNIKQCMTIFTYYRLFRWLTLPPTF